jgi:hypothetical protein
MLIALWIDRRELFRSGLYDSHVICRSLMHLRYEDRSQGQNLRVLGNICWELTNLHDT